MSAEEIIAENNRRLTILFRDKNDWLIAAAYNITKDRENARDIVSELYLYLTERGNPKIWFGTDGFNMLYLYSFLKSRWINQIKRDCKIKSLPEDWDCEDRPYDEEGDINVQRVFQEVVDEIEELQKTRMWASAKLAQIYFFTPDMTLDRLSKEIGISKSTSFLNIRKIKQHFRKGKDNPFRQD